MFADVFTSRRAQPGLAGLAGLGLALLGWSCPLWAGPEQDAARLGTSLTPTGGEMAASGGVPAWAGLDKPGPGWAAGQPREAAWAYRDEKPLLTIDAAGAAKAAERLTPGQQQMFKKNPLYRMDVYPTHRHCGAPDWVNENTRSNVGQARLSEDGNVLQQAALPGVPFPIPANGAQVIWNFQTRYQGVGVEWPSEVTLVSPAPGTGGNWIEVGARQTFYYPWGQKAGRQATDLGPVLSNTYYGINSPAALAGQGLFGKVSFGDAAGEVQYYFPGQRRVRRMPTYAYDAPQIGFENQYTIDQTLMFTGNIDRFDWKILGKKEIYVPYNTFKLFDAKAKRGDVYQESFVNPAYRRYELHRVWVLEATVKNGMRHTAPRKLFYVDEDSWLILVGEDYDSQGALWKLRESSAIPVWELGGACASATFVQMDLQQGRYVADFVTAGTGKEVQWFAEPGKHTMLKQGFYTADNLRAISER